MKLPAFRLTTSSVINVIGGLVVVYLMVVLGQTIKRNYDLGMQISQLQAQTNLLQTQKDALSYNIQYYNTGSFRDREARSKLGLQKPGENVIIIPEPSAAPAPTSSTSSSKSGTGSNASQWVNFLLGRW